MVCLLLLLMRNWGHLLRGINACMLHRTAAMSIFHPISMTLILWLRILIPSSRGICQLCLLLWCLLPCILMC